SLEHMRKRLRVPESALIDVYRFYGNQVAASIPTAMADAQISRSISEGFKAAATNALCKASAASSAW
ncbi:3-oxoacyl-[acyl-carrier-protein] synthase III C-terminal domain-containing protein, partial [Escherichia coli]|uniref:3-oxoacyl-[acyl-carrier-protein] synthase III C-terminal domain-containing protein n=1 Tax=Escherichia coli TaxID=562 RepID=UPI003EE2D3C0